MPEITSATTQVTCNEEMLTEVVKKFRHVLELFYCATPSVLVWLSKISWPSLQEGYSVEYPCSSILFEGEVFPLRPYIEFALCAEEDKWKDNVTLGFLLEAEPLREGEESQYKLKAGKLVWRIIEALAFEFPEVGAYLTDEVQTLALSEALKDDVNLFWSFDAALVPKTLLERFLPAPDFFAIQPLNNYYGVVWRERWMKLPYLRICT